MPTDQETLALARRLDRPAVEAIFAENYSQLVRMAMALSGREDVGAGVVRFAVKQALHALPNWKDTDAPQRWFLHHTILTTRRAAKHQPDATNDTLIADPRTASPEYVAFIRALRGLPMQQREAFILHHGERLNERWSAVSMDCSVIAATNHLNAATATLMPIAGTNFGAFVEAIARVYKNLTPAEELMVPKLKRTIAHHLWPRRIARLFSWIVILSLIAAIAYGALVIWPKLEF